VNRRLYVENLLVCKSSSSNSCLLT
jgi:hypothetical protein